MSPGGISGVGTIFSNVICPATGGGINSSGNNDPVRQGFLLLALPHGSYARIPDENIQKGRASYRDQDTAHKGLQICNIMCPSGALFLIRDHIDLPF